jgi:dihydrofolate synthase/folylpolyglutamate synthase
MGNDSIRTFFDSPYKYLASLDSKGIRLDLDSVKRILARLGNPEKNYPTVLVAGTNGKGSICAILSSILNETGMKVGFYTSPHLMDFRERIKVNNRLISRTEMLNLISEIRSFQKEDLTYFEFATVLAFLYFQRQKVDIAVLEIGLGGRLDATNVVDPEVSIISNISMEHCEYLGNTLEKITREKAGIIRKKGCCVTGSKNPIVIHTLEKICNERGAVLYRIGKDMEVRTHQDLSFSYTGRERHFCRLRSPLHGRHQIDNAAVALGAVEVLAKKGLPINNVSIEEGLKKTQWQGRFETILSDPTVVVDGAHNPAGIAALIRTIKEVTSYRKLFFIFGVLKSKEYKSMLRKLASIAPILIVTGLKNTRGEDPAVLSHAAQSYFQNVIVKENAEGALHYALKQAQSEDLICVSGSLFLVGEIKQILKKK